ncbi:2-hydroxyacid dehydrogenase family protein [Luedemannella flava]|uniref:2-hydroxyacid dehydrogenase family protein n=1 Tax=Luedemannella flava TaxID=349316 RepID=A0ABN2LC31_9ACTN
MVPKIFVSQPVPDVALNRLREYGEVEVFPWAHREVSIGELESAARRSDYIFCMHSTPISESMVAANPELRGYGLAAARPELHAVDACEKAGIKLLIADRPAPPADGGWSLNGYGLNPRATADLMVALILNLAYRVVEADRYCRRNGFFQEMTMDLMGQGCTGKTVALYGLGRVARQAVRKLRALDMTVLYTKRTALSEAEEAELGVEWVGDPDELIARGDYVCMLANFEDRNLRLMGEREFALMKPTAYFINVGRGRLVDEDAMIRALRDGVIAGAGLDVYWHEPPVVHDPYIPLALRAMDNVVLTPHNGGATHDSRGAQTLAIANAIVADIVATRKV